MGDRPDSRSRSLARNFVVRGRVLVHRSTLSCAMDTPGSRDGLRRRSAARAAHTAAFRPGACLDRQAKCTVDVFFVFGDSHGSIRPSRVPLSLLGFALRPRMRASSHASGRLAPSNRPRDPHRDGRGRQRIAGHRRSAPRNLGARVHMRKRRRPRDVPRLQPALDRAQSIARAGGAGRAVRRPARRGGCPRRDEHAAGAAAGSRSRSRMDPCAPSGTDRPRTCDL
jgi:hypothetical protein